MISFYRMGTPVAGHRKEAADYAKSVADYISSNHGVEASAAVRVGGPSGRVGIRVRFDDMAGLESWIDQARADGDYIKLTTKAAGVMADSEDAVWKVI